MENSKQDGTENQRIKICWCDQTLTIQKKQKLNIIQTTINTSKLVSSPRFCKFSVEKAKSVLETNGYFLQKSSTSSFKKKYHCFQKQSKNTIKNVLPIPFISDNFTQMVRKSLWIVGLEATVVELNSPNLQQLLVSNRLYDIRCVRRNCRVCPEIGDGSCAKKGAIYRLDCDCGSFYIGETGRPLADRINEHSRAAEKPKTSSYKNTVWAKHSLESHNGDSLNISMKILGIERDTWKRRILEGIYIKTYNPDLNTKEEITDLVSEMGILEIK
jgi:predicted GIY-YIG superfamily endonuclease